MTCFVCSRRDHRGAPSQRRVDLCLPRAGSFFLPLSRSRSTIKQQASCSFAWGGWLDLPLLPSKGHELQKDFRLSRARPGSLIYLKWIREQMHCATNLRPGRQSSAEHRASLLRIGTKSDIRRKRKEWKAFNKAAEKRRKKLHGANIPLSEFIK